MTTIDIFNDNTISNNDCSICLSVMDNESTIHELQDCKHKFHTSCLINWLVISNCCPLCRNKHQSTSNKSFMFKHIIDFLRSKKNTNKHLKKIYTRYKTIKEEYKKHRLIHNSFMKDNKDLLSQYKKIKRKDMELYWKNFEIKKEIMTIPITPIFIQKNITI